MAQSWGGAIDRGVTLLIVATCAVLLYQATKGPEPPPVPREAFSVEGSATQGTDAAAWVLVSYSDYQCSYCDRFEQTVAPAIIEKYVTTGRLQIVYRHSPVESIHPLAVLAATAAICADQQGKFLDMHHRLFRLEEDLGRESILDQANGLGLDPGEFVSCLDSSEVTAEIRSQRAEAVRFGYTGTPAFLLGRRQGDGRVKAIHAIIGALSPDKFLSEIDSVVSGPSLPLLSVAVGILMIVGTTWAVARHRRNGLAGGRFGREGR